MNWQFFATAGVISGILLVIAFVSFLMICTDFFSYDTEEVLSWVTRISLLIVLVFWFVVGIIALLSLTWDWGLVV